MIRLVARTEALPTIAIAVAAVDRTVLIGLERQLSDIGPTLGAFQAEGGDVKHLALRTRTLSVIVHVSTSISF